MERYYNIHNLIRIKVENKNQYLIEELDYSLRYFIAQGKSEDADIEIKNFEEFLLPKESLIISDKFFGFKGGFYNKEDKYAILIKGGKITLYAKENIIAVNSLIEYFLLKKGFTFLHGAGASYKNKAVVFPSPPNTGKTTLISKLREKEDVKFFGDDYVIIKKDGTMYSYPMDFSIHNYHFNFYRELKKAPEGRKIKRIIYEKILISMVKNFPIRKTLKKIARFFKYDFLKGGEYLKIPAERLIGSEKIGKSAKLEYCVCLNKYEGKDLKIEKISVEAAVGEIMGVLQAEWQKTMPAFYLLAAFGALDFADYLNKIKTVLKSGLGGLKFYRVLLPSQMEHQQRFLKLEEFLENEIFSKKNGHKSLK